MEKYQSDKVYSKDDWRRVSECIHSHTIYCNHAQNTPLEMIEKAIKEEYEIFGISEHMPFLNTKVKKGFHAMRPTLKKYDELLNEVRSYQEKYKDKIKIYMGVESEYYPEKEDHLKNFIKDKKADYIIYGNHSSKFGKYYSEHINDKNILDIYVNTALKGMETGLFLYMAHPDFIFKDIFDEWNEEMESMANKICAHAKKHDYAIGFNINGMRFFMKDKLGKSRMKYPIKEFWQVAKKHGTKIFIEQDAHNREMLDNIYWTRAVLLIYEWGLEDYIVQVKDLNIEEHRNKILNMK